MKTGYIIVDIGTGNTRAGIFSDQGECLAINTVDTEYIKDREYDDACSFNPNRMFFNIMKVIKKSIGQAGNVEIKGITSTSQRQGIVLIDRKGESFLGLPNIDNRGKEFVDKIGKKKLIYNISGRWARKYFSAYKLFGLKEKRRQDYDRISKITSISDWVGYKFTGELSYEPSQACETQLFETENIEYSRELCEIFGVDPGILPEIRYSGKLLGKLKPELALELDINRDVPFIVGGGDTQFAVKGTRAKIRDFVVTAGTTTPVTYMTDNFFIDEKERCWMDCHIDRGSFLVETNVGVTGLNYQNLKKVFFPDRTYDQIGTEMDIAEPPKCGCAISTMDFAKGEELSMGGFVFNTPVLDLKASDFAYSVLFNMACGVKDNIEEIEAITGRNCLKVIGCGGGFNGDLFPQIVSNLLDKKVVLNRGFSQASGLGGVNILNDYFGSGSSEAEVYKEYHSMDLDWCEEAYQEWKVLKQKLN